MCDKAKGLCITSEKHIGELGVRCLSPINRGRTLPQQSPLMPLGEAGVWAWGGGGWVASILGRALLYTAS